jgi:predicted PurR-regulated permease PerM
MSHSAPGSQDETQSRTFGLTDIPTPLAWKIAAILAIALAVGMLALDVLDLLIRPLGVLFAAIVVALTLAPIVDILERWMPRILAVLTVYAGLVLIIIGFGLVLVPPVFTQMSSLIENFPEHYRDTQLWLARELGFTVRNDMEQLSTFAAPAADYLLQLPRMIIATSAEFIVGFFVSLYWLHTMPRLKAWILSLFHPDQQEPIDQVMGRISERMGGYMRGVVISGLAVGAAVYIGLMILGVQYALLLAILAFLGEFFPNVGPILAGIPAVVIAFFDSPTMAVIVIIFYIVIQQIESYILVPMIMMRTLAHIPPLVTTFAVFTGFMVGGVLWAILAIPLSGAILTFTTDVIAPAVRKKTGAPNPEEELVYEADVADSTESTQAEPATQEN